MRAKSKVPTLAFLFAHIISVSSFAAGNEPSLKMFTDKLGFSQIHFEDSFQEHVLERVEDSLAYRMAMKSFEEKEQMDEESKQSVRSVEPATIETTEEIGFRLAQLLSKQAKLQASNEGKGTLRAISRRISSLQKKLDERKQAVVCDGLGPESESLTLSGATGPTTAS